MPAETEIIYEIDDQPSEVITNVIESVERGERSVIKRADPRRAQRSFHKARQENIELISAIINEYGLTEEQIRQHIGRDIQKTNEELMNLTKQMAVASIEQEKKGTAKISKSVLMDIEEVKTELRMFQDLLVGIEEGQARIAGDTTT